MKKTLFILGVLLLLPIGYGCGKKNPAKPKPPEDPFSGQWARVRPIGTWTVSKP